MAKGGRGNGEPLQDWASCSYDMKNGRQASSLLEAGDGDRGNHTKAVGKQIPSIQGRDKTNTPAASHGEMYRASNIP